MYKILIPPIFYNLY